MARAEKTVTIDADHEAVFAFLANGENNGRWRQGVLDVRKIGGTKDGLGARYKQEVTGPMGRTIAADYEVTEFFSGKRLAFKVTAGPARPDGFFELTPVGPTTRVRFVLSWEPTGVKKLLDGLVTKQMQKEVAHLTGLKAVLEAKSQ